MKQFVCPKCQGNPIFYKGCRNCGSANMELSKMIHHYACANVDRASVFENGCPKCKDKLTEKDFEYLDGTLDCKDCSWSNVGAEIVGLCKACDLYFPIHCAGEIDAT